MKQSFYVAALLLLAAPTSKNLVNVQYQYLGRYLGLFGDGVRCSVCHESISDSLRSI